MNQLTGFNVILIVLQLTLSVLGNVKITPIAIDSKKNDMKGEEARYTNPIVPEYYGSNYYDRNRQGGQNGFLTSYGSQYPSSYGTSSYGTSGYGGSSYDRYGTSSYDNKYGSKWSDRDKIGTNYDNTKFNYMPGGVYNPNVPNSPYSPNPYGPQINGPMFGGSNGIFGQEFQEKTSAILPLAGAALLGIATYALVAGAGVSIGPMLGKRKRRSLLDEKLDQHMAYRAHKRSALKK